MQSEFLIHFLIIYIPEGRGVWGDDDELGLSFTDSSHGLFAAQHVLATLHDKTELAVDALTGLFLKIQARKHMDENNQYLESITKCHMGQIGSALMKYFNMASTAALKVSTAYI